MQITEIIKEKKHLCRVKTDVGSNVLLDADYIYEKSIKVGDEITEEALQSHFAESDYKRALSRSIWYIERGSLSEKKLKEKLKTAGFTEKSVLCAAERMKSLGLIDDIAFAERLAENLLASCVSKREALFKMQNKGIPTDIAKSALEEFECDAADQLRALVKKKYLNKLSTDGGAQKVFAALVRKGFSYADIKTVLKEFTEENYEE